MWFNREKSVMFYDDIAKAIKKITGSKASLPTQDLITGKPNYDLVDSEEGLTLKYCWEGEWQKNGGDAENYPPYCSNPDETKDGFTFHSNNGYWYWGVIQSDEFANFTQPYIRVTCKDGNIDTSALQLAPATYKANFPEGSELALEKCTSGKETDIPAEDDWNGKIYAIDKKCIEGDHILWISGSNKPIFTKIEIFDGPALQK